MLAERLYAIKHIVHNAIKHVVHAFNHIVHNAIKHVVHTLFLWCFGWIWQLRPFIAPSHPIQVDQAVDAHHDATRAQPPLYSGGGGGSRVYRTLSYNWQVHSIQQGSYPVLYHTWCFHILVRRRLSMLSSVSTFKTYKF